MFSSIKSLTVTYDPINNETNTFTSGDFITGRVTLETSKETEVNSFFVKIKGKARVLWTERHGSVTMVYYNKETIFKSEHYFIQENGSSPDEKTQESEDLEMCSGVIPPGCHVYPFTFQIPQQDLPSSFIGYAGKVIYYVEAKLKRSKRISSKEKTEFNVLSMTDMHDPDMKEAQFGSVEKGLRFLNSGNVSINANIDSMKYYPGDEVKITAEIQNNSSRAIKPKYCLTQKESDFALNTTRVRSKHIVKGEGEPIGPSTTQTVTLSLTIPSDITPTFANWTVLKVEYRLKVYLDVKYSRDPGVKFPLVILGPLRSTDGVAAGATGGTEAGATSEALARATGEAAAGATGGASAPAVGLVDSRGSAEALEPTEPPPSYDSLYPRNSRPTEKH